MMEKKRILILVKVEPAPSKKYGSTVCTAGITEDGEFIRLYPIPFSLFCDKDRKFSKYDWIECECEKAEPGDDARKESYKVKADSIHVVGHIDTDYRWAERNNIVRPHISRNFKELVAEGSSLGIIRPKEVKLGDMRVGGFRIIAITNITDSCYYTHNPSLSSWRRTSEKSKRS